MGKRRSIQIDTRLFEKAGDGSRFFSDMLSRYSIGQVVSQTDALDLAALLKRHHEFDEKVGVGIAHFDVAAPPDGHDGQCFWILRTDRSRVAFSFKHCLETRPSDS